MLSPKIDVVFRMLFGEQKHERITKRLIEEKVETIELEQTPLLWGNQADDKLGIIDVRATIKPTANPYFQPQMKPHNKTGMCIGRSILPICGICPVANGRIIPRAIISPANTIFLI